MVYVTTQKISNVSCRFEIRDKRVRFLGTVTATFDEQQLSMIDIIYTDPVNGTVSKEIRRQYDPYILDVVMKGKSAATYE